MLLGERAGPSVELYSREHVQRDNEIMRTRVASIRSIEDIAATGRVLECT